MWQCWINAGLFTSGKKWGGKQGGEGLRESCVISQCVGVWFVLACGFYTCVISSPHTIHMAFPLSRAPVACGRGGAGLEVEGGSAASRSSQNHSSKHDCGVCQISFDSEEALCGFLVFLRAACACPIACGSRFVTWSMCVRVGTRVVRIPAQWNISVEYYHS